MSEYTSKFAGLEVPAGPRAKPGARGPRLPSILGVKDKHSGFAGDFVGDAVLLPRPALGGFSLDMYV